VKELEQFTLLTRGYADMREELKARGIARESHADYRRLADLNYVIAQTRERIRKQRLHIAELDEGPELVATVEGARISLSLLREMQDNRKELVEKLATRHKLP
jgi:hypothetical protein